MFFTTVQNRDTKGAVTHPAAAMPPVAMAESRGGSAEPSGETTPQEEPGATEGALSTRRLAIAPQSQRTTVSPEATWRTPTTVSPEATWRTATTVSPEATWRTPHLEDEEAASSRLMVSQWMVRLTEEAEVSGVME